MNEVWKSAQVICRRVHNWKNQTLQDIFGSEQMKSAGLMEWFNCHPTHSFLTNNLYPDQVQRSSGSKLLKAIDSLRSSFNGEYRIGRLRNLIQFFTDMLDILQKYTDSLYSLSHLIDFLKILSGISNNFDPHKAQQKVKAWPRGYKTFFQAKLSWARNLSCS